MAKCPVFVSHLRICKVWTWCQGDSISEHCPLHTRWLVSSTACTLTVRNSCIAPFITSWAHKLVLTDWKWTKATRVTSNLLPLCLCSLLGSKDHLMSSTRNKRAQKLTTHQSPRMKSTMLWDRASTTSSSVPYKYRDEMRSQDVLPCVGIWLVDSLFLSYLVLYLWDMVMTDDVLGHVCSFYKSALSFTFSQLKRVNGCCLKTCSKESKEVYLQRQFKYVLLAFVHHKCLS